MKFQTKAKDFSSAVNTVLAVHDFGESGDDRQPCCLTAAEDVLTLESAKMGAYVIKRLPGKLLRAGTVGLNCKDLASMKLSGTITMNATKDKIKIQDGRTTYEWALDPEAKDDIAEQRDTASDIQKLAKIPTLIMKSGAKFATYKSEIDDYDVQITIQKGQFEYCGLDHLSYGRYVYTDEVVRSKRKFHFTLGNSLLAKIMKEVQGDELVVGTTPDNSIVRISTDDLDLFHPTVDKPYQSAEDTLKSCTGGGATLSCRFTVDQKELKEAIERVAPVGKKAADALMKIEISSKGAVRLLQSAHANAAHCKLKVQETEVDEALSFAVRAQYLKEFVKAAPTTVPLTVESWDQQFLRITVEEQPGLIDYLAMMTDE